MYVRQLKCVSEGTKKFFLLGNVEIIVRRKKAM
jgi:hypothetical protein